MGFLAPAKAPRHPVHPSVGAYLTDGTKLLRIESLVRTRDGEELIEIEDCRTLDRWIWPVGELEQAGMRPVSPERSSTRGRR